MNSGAEPAQNTLHPVLPDWLTAQVSVWQTQLAERDAQLVKRDAQLVERDAELKRRELKIQQLTRRTISASASAAGAKR